MTTPPPPVDQSFTDPGPAGIPEGFPGERLHVMPRPAIRAALARPVTGRLLVTDCGYFPHAKAHGRDRPEGADEAVVIVCADGAGWVRLGNPDDAVVPVRRGQAVLIPPGRPHAYGADPDDPWTIWWLHAAGSDVPDLLGAGPAGPAGSAGSAGPAGPVSSAGPAGQVSSAGSVSVQSPTVLLPREPLRAVDLIAEAITALDRDLTDASLLTASGAAWHLLALLAASPFRLNGSPDFRGPGYTDDAGATPAARVDQVADHLRRHPENPSTVADLAAMVHLSASHLAALFRERTGTSVLRYAVDVRMSRARYLLDTTVFGIAEVARRCGYRDAFYFSRQFKKLHGVTPRDYRRQRKG